MDSTGSGISVEVVWNACSSAFTLISRAESRALVCGLLCTFVVRPPRLKQPEKVPRNAETSSSGCAIR